MRSFSEYVQNKNVDALVSEIAHKMVEVNVDPWNFLIEYYKNNPELVIALENHKEETLNEFLGGLKRMGQALWGGAKQFGKDLGTATQALGGSAVDTAKQMRAKVAGPEAHYAASIEALQGLSRELSRNKEVQAAMQSGDPQVQANYKKVVGDLQGILKQLDQQKQQVTNLLSRQQGSLAAQTMPGTMGASPQAQIPGATPTGAKPQTQPFPRVTGFAGSATGTP